MTTSDHNDATQAEQDVPETTVAQQPARGENEHEVREEDDIRYCVNGDGETAVEGSTSCQNCLDIGM